LEYQLISAQQATCFLNKPQNHRRPLFLVLVSDTSDTLTTPDSDPSSADPRLTPLLSSYSDVFEQASTGLVDAVAPPSVTIAPNAIPPNRPAFRLSLPEGHELQVTKMLEKPWIQSSRSPYGAPVLFVPRPDGVLRMCIDYCARIKIALKKKYHVPRIEDLLDNLMGPRYFSFLDFTSGYYHLRLPASDLLKTAFNAHFGKFEWHVYLFPKQLKKNGLSSALLTTFASVSEVLLLWQLLLLSC
jgi:hypothetical protein